MKQKKKSQLAGMLFSLLAATAALAADTNGLALIPLPQQMELRAGAFMLTSDTRKEVILEQVELPGEKPQWEGSGGQSYLAFWRGFFAGVEFPIAGSCCVEQGTP